MTTLANITTPGDAAPTAPQILPINECPNCQRPLDAGNLISEQLSLGRRASGDVKVLVWCPACVSGYRLFIRNDGLSSMVSRVDRLEHDETEGVRVRKHYELAKTQKGGE